MYEIGHNPYTIKPLCDVAEEELSTKIIILVNHATNVGIEFYVWTPKNLNTNKWYSNHATNAGTN